MKTILITGANGFIGKNLIWHLQDKEKYNIIEYNKTDAFDVIKNNIDAIDCIVHLAGICRSKNANDFFDINSDLTDRIVSLLEKKNKSIPMIFTSSVQVEKDNDYGKSKLIGETSIQRLGENGFVIRLHNVFGKWAKENNHSVVANFCYNVANHLQVRIDDANAVVEFIYIDDVIKKILDIINGEIRYSKNPIYIEKRYKITVGELAQRILNFDKVMQQGILPNTENEFSKRLFSTYLTYIPINRTFALINHEDKRGNFVEVFKLQSSGQISFSTTIKGEIRAGHYHHSKVEQIIVINGMAKVTFTNLLNNEKNSLLLSDTKLEVVTLPPGYYHTIENIGNSTLQLLIWSNSVYDEKNADTYKL